MSEVFGLIDKKLAYEKYWLKLYLEQHKLPKGDEFEFVVVDGPDWALVVPETHDGKLVMISNYRPAWRQVSIEFPGGRVDPGEDITTAAHRELKEETGYRAKKLERLMTARPVSWTTQTMSIFHATQLMEDDQDLQPEEDITVILVEPSEIPKFISDGRIMQSTTILAYSLWKSNLSF